MTVTFSKAMVRPPPATAGFKVTVTGSADTVTAIALDSNSSSEYDLTLNTAVNIKEGQTVTLTYACRQRRTVGGRWRAHRLQWTDGPQQ